MGIAYNKLTLDKPELINIRKTLYGSESPGYYIFKNFIPENFVQHMRTFWGNEVSPKRSFSVIEEVDKLKMFYNGCPNYYYPTPYGHAFYNYFWNKPVDETTTAVSFSINYFRNIIEDNKNYDFFYPNEGNSCSYRVVFSLQGEQIVKPHTDWLDVHFNPAKLQATLMLSKHGVDYSGEGIKMASNNKKETFIFGKNVDVNPGDLIIWRYNNLHSVENVKTEKGQIGLVRMIFPPEFINPVPQEITLNKLGTNELVAELKKRIKQKIKQKIK